VVFVRSMPRLRPQLRLSPLPIYVPREGGGGHNADDMPEAVYPTHMEKPDSNRRVLVRDVLHQVQEAVVFDSNVNKSKSGDFRVVPRVAWYPHARGEARDDVR